MSTCHLVSALLKYAVIFEDYKVEKQQQKGMLREYVTVWLLRQTVHTQHFIVVSQKTGRERDLDRKSLLFYV